MGHIQHTDATKKFHSYTGMIGEWTPVTGLRCKRNMYNEFLTSSLGNISLPVRQYW